jgi:hypothetical protein
LRGEETRGKQLYGVCLPHLCEVSDMVRVKSNWGRRKERGIRTVPAIFVPVLNMVRCRLDMRTGERVMKRRMSKDEGLN